MQSELLPSACRVELPSKPHSGMSARAGVLSNDLIVVLPRRPGMGVLPSSQMYSSLYFVIVRKSPSTDACFVFRDANTTVAGKTLRIHKDYSRAVRRRELRSIYRRWASRNMIAI